MRLTVLLSFLVLATAFAATETENFDRGRVGALPSGWLAAITGEGEPVWKTETDPSAASGSQALKQSGVTPRPSFPLCLKETPLLRDGFIEVKFKTLTGKIDQAAGLVWRAKDHWNYYVCRANALENNVVLYKIVNGKRTALDIIGRQGGYGVQASVSSNTWQSLRVEFTGQIFTAFLNGEKLFQVKDDSFAEAGKIGLWTKADSVTVFDDFEFSSQLPAETESGGGGSAIEAKLEQVVDIRQRLLRNQELLIQSGRAPDDASAAIDLAEARIQLALERGQRDEILKEITGLVGIHEERLNKLKNRSADRIARNEVDRARASLLEAEVRLLKARR